MGGGCWWLPGPGWGWEAKGTCPDPSVILSLVPPPREQCLQLRENHHRQLEIRVRVGSWSSKAWVCGQSLGGNGERRKKGGVWGRGTEAAEMTVGP